MRSPVKWAPQEITRFYRGFLKYGTEFDKVSKMVGGGKAPDMCEALYRQHQAYLSLDKKYQAEVAFVAMVQDAFNQVKDELPDGKGATSGAEGEAMAGSDGEQLEVKPPVSESARGSRGRIGGVAGKEDGNDDGLDVGEGSEDEDSLGGARGRGRTSVASARPKRTPVRNVVRTPPGVRSARRTPQSSNKRPRAALRDDDIYEYYDPELEAITESARKRRVSQKRLDFHQQSLSAVVGPALGGGRRREAAEEAKGIDALLSLAVAGEEMSGGISEQEEEEEERRHELEQQEADEAVERQLRSPAGRPLRSSSLHSPLMKRALAEAGEVARGKSEDDGDTTEEEMQEVEGMEDDDDAQEAGALDDDDEDEDYSDALPSRRRRTPISTPLRTRSRPSSAHVTPRRTGLRGVTSPGLRGLGSPAWLGLSDTELVMGELGIPDLSYLSSPGFVPPLPAGYVPSPKNPMPRLRRRKYAPTKSPPVVSPLKGIFASRRQSLARGPPAPSLLTSGFGGAYGGGSPAATASAGEEGVVMSPMEVQLRHCLNARVRRWCQFEFFYSAIDRPWFMQNTMQAALAQMAIGNVNKLTRKEWNMVRAGLGKPRRLSMNFLKDQRASLEAWRESVRAHYAATGAPESSPVDAAAAARLPRALNVGQRVTARHPTTRLMHDGSVLTAAPNCYRIQFDRRELGVELVRDCDIMPADPAESLPTAVLAANPLLLLNGRYIVGGQPVRPPAARTIFPLAFSSIQAMAPAAAAAAAAALSRQQQSQQQQQQQQAPLPAQQQAAPQQPQQQHPQQQQPVQQGAQAPPTIVPAAVPAPLQAPDSAQRVAVSAAEAQALSELAVNLDKKEALLVQLRAMNDEAAAGVHAVRGGAPGSAGGSADTSQAFKLAYAKVLLQLRETNDRMASKLLELDALRRGEGLPASMATTQGPEVAGVGGSSSQGKAPSVPSAPDTAESLVAVALLEARAMVASCKRKLADAAADSGRRSGAAGEPLPMSSAGLLSTAAVTQPLDWEAPAGRLLGGVIEGCVWSLMALQKGCGGAAPAPAGALAGALDTALTAVRPHAAANQQLYADIRQAMDALRSQLLLAS